MQTCFSSLKVTPPGLELQKLRHPGLQSMVWVVSSSTIERIQNTDVIVLHTVPMPVDKAFFPFGIFVTTFYWFTFELANQSARNIRCGDVTF